MDLNPTVIVLGTLALYQLVTVAYCSATGKIPNVLTGCGLAALLLARMLVSPTHVVWYLLVMLAAGLIAVVVGFVFLKFPGGMIKMVAVSAVGLEMLQALQMTIGVLCVATMAGFLTSRLIEKGTLPGPWIVLLCTWVVVAAHWK